MSRTLMTRRGGYVWLGGLSCAGALVGACSNPFATMDSEYGERVAIERLRAIEPLDLGSRAAGHASEMESPRAPVDVFAGMDRIAVSLEQCRAWTLANNLDLHVSLIDPVIANERLSEEEARFEATFFVRSRYSDFDQPTASQLSGNQVQNFDFNPGVRIPLRTGGEITVDMPINRVETDNIFSTLNPAYTSDARFSISQPLLRGGGRRTNTHGIRIAALESQIVQARAKLEVIRQLAEVDRAYWRLYAAQQLLKVRQEQYELAYSQLERAERRVRAQVAAQIEVVRAQEGAAQRLEGILIAQNLVKQTQRDLKRIINVAGLELNSPVTFELSTEPDPVRYDLEPDAIADSAVGNRMEMLELELRLAQDMSSIDFNKNQALPLFTVDYTYNYNGLGSSFNESLDVLRDREFADWTLGVTFEVPLGNEAAESRVNQAILTRLQRLATRQLRDQVIRQEVYNALDGLEAAWQRILAARQTTILAGRTLEAEQSQFGAGLSTSTDVLDAATRLADAQQAEIRALADYQIAQVDLAFATGTLLGAMRINWDPIDPRGPEHHFGERGWPTGSPNAGY